MSPTGNNYVTSCLVFKKNFGPGPCHAINPAITYKGPDGTPHITLASRHKELTPFNTPGPGTYAPETKKTCFQGEKQKPAYSMGARSRYRKSKIEGEERLIATYHHSFFRRRLTISQFLYSSHHDWTQSS